MTFAPPTQTNPPFTTPPTWPFKTTSERWETDYRLKLLEAGLIYMWTNAVGGSPTGPAGGALAGTYPNPTLAPGTTTPPSGPASGDLAGSYPNPRVQSLQTFPVAAATPQANQVLTFSGGNWIPITPTAFFPPQAPPPTGFNSYTDPSGEVWVSLNGTLWKKARDVLHARWYRTAAWNYSAQGPLTMDTMSYDIYSLFSGSTFTAPIAGIWRLRFQAGSIVATTPVPNWQQVTIVLVGGGNLAIGAHNIAQAGSNVAALAEYVAPIASGTQWQVQQSGGSGSSGVTGSPWTFVQIDYMGTN